MNKSMSPARNASQSDAGGNAKEDTKIQTLPPRIGSRFSGNKGNFGFANVQKISNKGQFTPPAIRVTQNKGGGGK